MTVYDFEVEKANGEKVKLGEYRGKVLLIVNTATKCGLTPQLEGLQTLYDRYREEGLEILGFPCNQFANQEPHGNDEIHAICKLNYGVTFPIFAKIDVNGRAAHPLYQYLVRKSPGIFTKAIKWNFTKFLIDQEGNVVKRYAPSTKPEKIESKIRDCLKRQL